MLVPVLAYVFVLAEGAIKQNNIFYYAAGKNRVLLDIIKVTIQRRPHCKIIAFILMGKLTVSKNIKSLIVSEILQYLIKAWKLSKLKSQKPLPGTFYDVVTVLAMAMLSSGCQWVIFH